MQRNPFPKTSKYTEERGKLYISMAILYLRNIRFLVMIYLLAQVLLIRKYKYSRYF